MIAPMEQYSLFDYHERSKHRLDRYAPGPGRLDWANQPDPFRRYEGAARTVLPLRADDLDTRYGELRSGRMPVPRVFDLDSIATLLELSLGLSAWKAYGGTQWALRCNPSSGNLHPTEGYLVTGGVPGIAAGVHHYLSCDHALEHRGEWDRPVELRGILVGFSSIAWREAWKYGMRAFRYCQHDCGHAIAAVSYAAAAIGWSSRLLTKPGDAQVAALLGLDREETSVEPEAPDCLLWISTGEPPPAELPPAPSRWHGKANRLSADHVHWSDIEKVHALTVKPATETNPSPPPPTKALGGRLRRGPSPTADDPSHDMPAAQIFRQRRSAVSFDGVTGIHADAFFAMLDATLPGSDAPPWCAWPWPAAVHLAIMVHRVDTLEPGLYLLVRDPEALAPLKASLRPEWLWRKAGPPELPLYLLIPYDLRDAARQICCHQDIAADSCYALGMLARYESAASEPWRYRALYWECGMLGQVLYLEAEAAGIRATGIGCFFDDEMHALLGLRGHEWQSLYHFTAGGPLDDTRLTTLPPYSRD
ncbi:MAG TPA: SagB/ThcOx family dehydrogenase [Burkholderiales bacterium]|nr:SagB/ThcOx family dehydrogenase [Burkholderiales bacterium]